MPSPLRGAVDDLTGPPDFLEEPAVVPVLQHQVRLDHRVDRGAESAEPFQNSEIFRNIDITQDNRNYPSL